VGRVPAPLRPHLSRIYSIGHGNRTFDEFVEALESRSVSQLVDVRSFPGSRRNPQFGQQALGAGLTAKGIGYRWMKELGGRRRPKPHSPHTGWRVEGFRAYADYMETPEFAAGLDALVQLAGSAAVAYMCAERLWWQCHRRLLSDALVVRGLEVIHILDAQKSDAHKLTGFLQVENGRLLYAK
jgi:uncharacterized protein (DUF488 family)